MARAQNVTSSIAYRQGRQGYVTGFVRAAALTVIPFLLVGVGAMPRSDLLWIIGVLGLIVVRYFLHVDLTADHREEFLLVSPACFRCS